MKGVPITKFMQELGLENLTPEMELNDKQVTVSEINRPALQLTGYMEHFASKGHS